MSYQAITLPMRADIDVRAFFNSDVDLETPVKRRMILTYVCARRNPQASPDELNRRYHIADSAKDVEKCLRYLNALSGKLHRAFEGVDFNSPLEIIAHIPHWIRYGCTVDLYRDLKNL